MKQDYLIAGHRIRVEGDQLVKAMDTLEGFALFKAETDDEPICRLRRAVSQPPELEQVYYQAEIDGIVSRFGSYTDGYAFDMTPPDGEPLILWMEKKGNKAFFEGNFESRLLRYACWIAYGIATVPFNTVAVHTSTIQYQGKAVLFLGESGTGKSTHTRLWWENIEEAVLLNDDSPILRLIDGKLWVYGSPWSGKTPCYKNERYPLAACVRLSQAPKNRIRRLSIIQGYGALHPSCPPCFAYDDRLYEHISGVLSALLATVPVYHLACLPNAEAAHLSCKTIFS